MEVSWEYLATVAGAAAVAVLIVQAVKVIVGVEINKWWLRLITFAICTGLLVGANAVLHGLTWASAGLYLVNGVVAYLVATGAYKTAQKDTDKSISDE